LASSTQITLFLEMLKFEFSLFSKKKEKRKKKEATKENEESLWEYSRRIFLFKKWNLQN
jgi:hypothetical protein